MIKELKIPFSITPRDSQALLRYFADISPLHPLTPDEEVELASRIHHGDKEARDTLVRANLRFVISVAKQYQNAGIALEDLINEGNIGLIRAAERFDPTRGFKFDTFAVWWIRQAITTALADSSRMVRLPLNVVGQISRIRKAETAFEQKYERMPSADELSELLDIPVERIQELRSNGNRSISLDAPLSDDTDTTMGEMLISTHSDSTDGGLMQESLRYDLGRVLETLPNREAEIIKKSFGLYGESEQSIDNIAMTMHLTRERVRQLREKALRTLRTRSASLTMYR